MHVFACLSVHCNIWRPGATSTTLACLPLLLTVSRDRNQLVSHGGKKLYPLSHRTDMYKNFACR